MQHATQRDELFAFLVDVFLVDLVGQNHDILLMTESHDVLEVLAAHNLTRWVTRVDHHD